MKNIYDEKINKLNKAKKELEIFENNIKLNIREYLKQKTIKNFTCLDGDFRNESFKDSYNIDVKSISENKIRLRLFAKRGFRYCGTYNFEKYINIDIDKIMNDDIELKKNVRSCLTSKNKDIFLIYTKDENRKKIVKNDEYRIEIKETTDINITVILSCDELRSDKKIYSFEKEMIINKGAL